MQPMQSRQPQAAPAPGSPMQIVQTKMAPKPR
jgi:hypothetical protein